MAAHAVTGLLQSAQRFLDLSRERDEGWEGKFLDYISPALTFSCWSEDLDLDPFALLYDAWGKADANAAFVAIAKALPDAVLEWLKYGAPRTREDWRRMRSIAERWPMGDGIVTHYGKHVDPNQTVGGVVANNSAHFLPEEEGIDLAWEEHLAECQNEYHDDCWHSTGSETRLIGDWEKKDDGLWEPDEDGPHGYAAIEGEIYTQVVWSGWTRRCKLCSICYPGQGDIGSEGDFTAYDLPPSVYGKDDGNEGQ
jgi:hypothetical protein